MYLTEKRKRYLFGCCPLSSQDFTDGRKAKRQLLGGGFYHAHFRVEPRAEYAARAEDFLTADDKAQVEIPKLFQTYLRVGAKVCGEPVINRHFKTIDFFVIVDAETVPEKYFKMFFS
jgi:putative hemolysin